MRQHQVSLQRVNQVQIDGGGGDIAMAHPIPHVQEWFALESLALSQAPEQVGVNRKLVINEAEATVVRRMFRDYPRVGSTTMLVQQLRLEGVTSKSWTSQSGKDRVGKLIDKGALYKILNNPLYVGDIRHKGVCYPGEHEAIITRGQWEVVQAALASKPNGPKKGQIRTERPALLKGLIFTKDGRAMTPHSTKGHGGRLYRYYLSTRDSKEGYGSSGVKMLPAGEIEQAVMVHVRAILGSAEVVTQVWREISKIEDKAVAGMTEMQVAAALHRIDLVWDQLFPLEQYRIIQLLVEQVVISPNELQVKLHPNGVENLALDVIRDPGRSRAKVAQEAMA